MIVRFANVIYIAAVAASIFLIFTVGIGWANGRVTEPNAIVFVVIAFLIFVAGRAVLYVFADR